MPNLNDMLAALASEGSTKLRTLCLEFADILARLPKLAQEVETWLKAPGIDQGELAERLEAALAQATDWLVDHDMLEPKVQETLAVFMQRATASATMRNLPVLVSKYREARDATGKKRTSDIVAGRGFIDNDDATLTDTRTTLMWKRTSEGRHTWSEAVRFNGKDIAVRFAGFDDWRLPTIDELKSLPLVDYSFKFEAFPGADQAHWSSTPYDSDGTQAHFVDFSDGHASIGRCDFVFSVRLVRVSQ